MRLLLNKAKLEQYMTKMGWDEKKLAAQIGVSHVQVYRVFREQRSPGNEFIAGLICACPDQNLKDLFIFDSFIPKGNKLKTG